MTSCDRLFRSECSARWRSTPTGSTASCRRAPPSPIGLPADVAADEGYWRDIQQAFTLDRTIINLNNGYTCPSPRVVHEALKRYLDSSNQAPIHFMWNTLEPNVEQVRRKLAVEVGCDMEELAITRNASEGLQIVQLGSTCSRAITW